MASENNSDLISELRKIVISGERKELGEYALNTVRLVQFASHLKTWNEMVAWTPWFSSGVWQECQDELRQVNPIFLALLSGGRAPDLVNEIYLRESRMYDEDTMVSALGFLDYWGQDVTPLGDSEAYELWQEDKMSSDCQSSYGSDSTSSEEVDDGENDEDDEDEDEEEMEEEEEL